MREYLAGDVVESTDGRVRFHSRVAVNVLAIIERELELGPAMAAAHRARLDRLGSRATRSSPRPSVAAPWTSGSTR